MKQLFHQEELQKKNLKAGKFLISTSTKFNLLLLNKKRSRDTEMPQLFYLFPN